MQDWSTLIIAITTIVYTVGTFWLWRSTRSLLRVNILVALLEHTNIAADDFEKLLSEAVPEAKDLLGKRAVLAIKKALEKAK